MDAWYGIPTAAAVAAGGGGWSTSGMALCGSSCCSLGQGGVRLNQEATQQVFILVGLYTKGHHIERMSYT
jgi:hypothetical protein